MPISDLTPSGGLQIGDTRTLKGTFTDAAGAPQAVVLAQVKLTVQDSSGVEVVYTGVQLTDGGTGIVTREQKFVKAGRWYWRWDWSDGTDSESNEVSAYVEAPEVTPSGLAQ